jgi:hypothetical protein
MNPTRLLAPIALALATACQWPQSNQSNHPVETDESIIRDLEVNSWVAANHDATFFERFLSEDHVEVHAKGIVGKSG